MTIAIPLVDIPAAPRKRGLGELRAGAAALPLAGVSLKARVIDRIAQVEVEQKFHNPFPDAIEAVYIFPLGGGCAVSAFELRVGARVLIGKVEERGEARRQYAEALQQGKRAALLEQERDDVFTVQVGNLPPGEEVTVKLTYSERLPFYEDGRTELRLPLVVAPRYVGGQELPREQAGHGVQPDTVTVPDASRITPPRLVPGFDPRVSLQIEAELFGGFSELDCSQHAVRSAAGPESAKVSLSREHEPLDRDFVLRWRLAGEAVKPQLLVRNGYAMLSLLPPARDGFLGAARDVIFVLDRSGSMQGPKMASAARACALLLRTLGPRDRFSALAFDNVVEKLPGGLTSADEDGLERGEKWLRGIEARGGTELDSALGEALQDLARRSQDEGRVPVVVILTDGEVGDESSSLKRVQTEVGEARVFTVGIDTAVNSGFLKRLAALGGGTCTLVEPGARLEEALKAVGREIGAPVITELKAGGMDLPDLFAGRASTAFLELKEKEKSVKVTGKWADGKKYSVTLEAREAPLAALEHLWARARISDLEDQFRGSHDPAVKQQIIALSVKHTLLTRFTAFVVIDPEVVNKGGERRTVVQPVATPAEWELDSAMPARGVIARGVMQPMGAPAPAYAPPPPMARAMKAAAPGSRGLVQRLKETLSAPTVQEATMGSGHAQTGTISLAELERVRAALEAFLKAFAAAHAELKAGKTPEVKALKEARMELLEALKLTLEIATTLQLLQRFLRGPAVELIAALQAGSAGPLFDQHAAELAAARDQARGCFAALPGKPPAGSFWEASI